MTWFNANLSNSGGGSVVSVTQIQSTGTKIATITVDSVDTDLYAPQSGASHEYSTDEQIVGTWIDGSTLYEKTILTSNSSVDLTSLGIDTLAKIEGVIQHTNGKVTPISYGSSTSDWAVPVYDVSSKTLTLAGVGTSQGGTWVLSIRYTKTST